MCSWRIRTRVIRGHRSVVTALDALVRMTLHAKLWVLSFFSFHNCMQSRPKQKSPNPHTYSHHYASYPLILCLMFVCPTPPHWFERSSLFLACMWNASYSVLPFYVTSLSVHQLQLLFKSQWRLSHDLQLRKTNAQHNTPN